MHWKIISSLARLKTRWGGFLLLLSAVLAGPVRAEAPNLVNIINFIRGVEPRTDTDLIEPVRKQLALAKEHKLPTTWLLQYDALVNPAFTDLLKREMGPDDEIGAWLEVVQPQVEAAGLVWRGRYPWDWHVNVGFTQGYSVEDRKKVLDVYMHKFKEVFGKHPKSVGSWIIDAPTLNYLHDVYQIESACNCKDQSGTDGYTLWGGYWNQAYYPSRLNAYMPAQTRERQLDVPVFRMLGSDPVHQYDQGIGTTWQGVVTLEPVYRPGGGDPKWVDWFFKTNFNPPTLGFSYMQAGQENSFGWPAMSAGLIDQYAKLAALRNSGKIRVETLQASGAWFRKNFKTTPATSITAMEDSAGEAKRSIWYESRFYRVNLVWEGDRWRVRDMHLFREDYAERYLNSRETTAVATYDTLPIVDGFHWSEPGDVAAITAVRTAGAESAAITTTGVPVVTKLDDDSLRITCGIAGGGNLVIHCDPARFRVEIKGASAPADWALELGWAAGRSASVAGVSRHAIGYQHAGFGYSLPCGPSEVTRNGQEKRVRIANADGAVTLNFDPDHSTVLWDRNGSQRGAGTSLSGIWDGGTPNWNPAPDGTGTPATWPGAEFMAVFAAGNDESRNPLIEVVGTRTAAGLQAKNGNVTLTGGQIHLTHPGVLRADAGAGLNVASPLTGESGIILEGEGNLKLGGAVAVSGPAYISATELSVAPGTDFSKLSRLGIGRSAAVSLAQATIDAGGPLEIEDGALLSLADSDLNFGGPVDLTGSGLSATGATAIEAERFRLGSGDGDATTRLSGKSSLRLKGSGEKGIFELNAGTLDLTDSASLHAPWLASRGEDARLAIAGGALLELSGRMVLGDGRGASLHVSQKGGRVVNSGTEDDAAAGRLANRWGHWPDAATTYEIQGGSLELPGSPLYLSWDSAATLAISGDAAVSLKGVEMGWGGRRQPSLLRMTGGNLKIGSHGIVAGGPGPKSIEFSGGTLGSLAGWSSSAAMTIHGPLAVDTSGGDISLTGDLTGKGGFTKTGAGTLSLGGANRLDGGISVTAGSLRISGQSPVHLTVGAGGSLAAGGATLAKLTLAAGATLDFAVGAAETPLVLAEPGGLGWSGVPRIRIRPAPGTVPGSYPLIQFKGEPSGTTDFELIETPGVEATLAFDRKDSLLKLTITSLDLD